MSNFDHCAGAENALALIMSADNPAAELSCANEATAHALLAIEDRLAQIDRRLAELVDVTRLGLVVNATVTNVSIPTNGEREAARAWIRDQIADIVNPEGRKA